MSTFTLFSKRQEANKDQVYQYDVIPTNFRQQLIYIWQEALGEYFENNTGYGPESTIAAVFWRHVYSYICRERGLSLLGDPRKTCPEQCEQYLMNANAVDALEIIELTFRLIDQCNRNFDEYEKRRCVIKITEDAAIERLNRYFRENSIGYQYTDGVLVRIDSEYIYDETIKPAITLLRDPMFKGAQDEFFNAHNHHRAGRYKETVTDCLKAFESTMKIICDDKSWSYAPNATASQLIKTLFDNHLIPQHLEDFSLGGLLKVLTSGVPTIRNKNSGHGQGSNLITIQSFYASFALNLTASNIVFLVEAYKATK